MAPKLKKRRAQRRITSGSSYPIYRNRRRNKGTGGIPYFITVPEQKSQEVQLPPTYLTQLEELGKQSARTEKALENLAKIAKGPGIVRQAVTEFTRAVAPAVVAKWAADQRAEEDVANARARADKAEDQSNAEAQTEFMKANAKANYAEATETLEQEAELKKQKVKTSFAPLFMEEILKREALENEIRQRYAATLSSQGVELESEAEKGILIGKTKSKLKRISDFTSGAQETLESAFPPIFEQTLRGSQVNPGLHNTSYVFEPIEFHPPLLDPIQRVENERMRLEREAQKKLDEIINGSDKKPPMPSQNQHYAWSKVVSAATLATLGFAVGRAKA